MPTFFQRYRSSLANRILRAGRAGFTLIELLVVIAVITIITAFILFSQNQFDSSTLLRSLAYQVALSLRQAQLYGVSVRGVYSASGTSFASAYGVNFSNSNLKQYTIFADLNKNGTPDTGESLTSAGGSLLTIGAGYSLSQFCAYSGSGSIQDCYPSGVGGGASITSLSMYFKRPLPDATFSTYINGVLHASNYSAAYVKVKSNGSSDFRTVKITNTGQIIVCPLNTAPPSC